jgi:hypothetical protein
MALVNGGEPVCLTRGAILSAATWKVKFKLFIKDIQEPFTMRRSGDNAGEKTKARTGPWPECILVSAHLAVFCAVAVSVPRRESRGKNGVSSNGILSRAEVIATGAALIISTLSCQGSSLILPPSGSAAT